MELINGIEGDILRKYIKGRIVESKDEFYLERMASTGLVGYGYDIDTNKITAKTTLMGRSSID